MRSVTAGQSRPSGNGIAQHGVGRSTRHVGSLDALRGLAALTVVFHHLALAYADRIHADVHGNLAWRMVDHAGHSSVILFFVLSGYVLQASYNATIGFTYGSYLLKRIFRIYPALLVALLLAWLLYRWFAIPRLPGPPLTWSDLARHAALVCRRGNDIALDGPIWSLAYEVRFSIVFPWLAALFRKKPNVALLGLLAVHVGAALLLHGSDSVLILGYDRIRVVSITPYYLICFGIGMYGCRQLMQRKISSLKPAAEYVAILISVAVLLLVRNELIVSLAGMGIIVLCLTEKSKTSKVLNKPLLLWLGSISYSLYLLHYPVLNAALASALRALPYSATVLTVVVASLAASAASYRLIERPGIALGRWAERATARRLLIVP